MFIWNILKFSNAVDSCSLNESFDETACINFGTLAAGRIIEFSGFQEAVADSRITGCSLVFCGADATSVGNSSLRWDLSAVPEAGSITVFAFALVTLVLARAFCRDRRFAASVSV